MRTLLRATAVLCAIGLGVWWGTHRSEAQNTCPSGGATVGCLPFVTTPLNGGEAMWGEQNNKTVQISVSNILSAIGVVPGTQSLSPNQLFATPNSSAGAPGFRALVTGDLPTVDVTHGGTGATAAPAARTNLGLGTAATFNSAGSGATLPTLQTNGASAGQCAVFSDNSGTLTSTTCSAGGGGAGTVAAGLTQQVARYASNGTTVSGDPGLTYTSSQLSVGVLNTTLGQFNLFGGTSGQVTIKPQAAAGTYNFNLPQTAGTANQPLMSGGGGSSPMTFGTLPVAGGGTGGTTQATAQAGLGLGTAATANSGTSAHVLGFLDGANTYSGTQFFNAMVRIARRTAASPLTFSATTDQEVCVDNSGGVATVNLPADAGLLGGEQMMVKDCKRVAGTNTITVNAGAGSTIEGAASQQILTNGGTIAGTYNKASTNWDLH